MDISIINNSLLYASNLFNKSLEWVMQNLIWIALVFLVLYVFARLIILRNKNKKEKNQYNTM